MFAEAPEFIRGSITGDAKTASAYAIISSSPFILGGGFVRECPIQRSTFSRRVLKNA